ncbi:MAG: hypothetical protein D6743_07770 [Calditrichaeota bacterium]|nr:MAG: hypothetical protein D6743_07770 [Calditrichota bacterium]
MVWIRSASTFFVVYFCFLVATPEAAAQRVTNLEFLTGLTDSLLDQATQVLDSVEVRTVVIRALDPQNDANWFFEDRLSAVAKAHGSPAIYLGAPGSEERFWPDSSAVIIEFEPLKLDVVYEQSDGVARAGYGKRIGNVGLFLRLVNGGTGRLLASDTIEARKSDWVAEQELDEIKSDKISFSKSEGGKKPLGKIVQPLLISGVTGILVYLFYSLRSR